MLVAEEVTIIYNSPEAQYLTQRLGIRGVIFSGLGRFSINIYYACLGRGVSILQR